MKYLLLFLLAANTMLAQSGIMRDGVKVRVLRVIDGDTFLVQYRSDTTKIRLRMENPRDTVDTFDKIPRRAKQQAARCGISVDSVRALSHEATAYMDSLLTDKTVRLRRYDDQTDLGRQFSYDRLLRGVEWRGKNVALLLRKRHLTVESFTQQP
jgi:endonuclease YncB( thermonuclease family)